MNQLTPQASMLKEELGAFMDKVRINEPLSLHTTYQIGGPADFFCTPANESELQNVIQACKKHDIAITVIGFGSNLLVSDRGIRGMTVCLNENFSAISEYTPNQIVSSKWFESLADEGCGDVFYLYADTGAFSGSFNYAAQNNWSGLEFVAAFRVQAVLYI